MLSSIGLLHSFTENASKSICTVFAQHFSIYVNICKCQSLLINITLLFMAITNTSSKKCQITENRYTIYLKEFKNKHRKSYLQKKKKKKWNENKCQSNMRRKPNKKQDIFSCKSFQDLRQTLKD